MTDIREIDERIAKCEKILSSNPGSQIFAALAEAHRRKGDIDKAFQVCQKGLKSHPNYGSAHVVMAKINLDKGLYDWAEKEVERASSVGGNAHAIEALRCEILLSRGDAESAITRLRRGLKVDPNNEQLQKLLELALEGSPKKTEVSFPSVPETPAYGAPPKTKRAQPAQEFRLSAGELLKQGLELDGVFGAIHQDHNGEVFDSCWDNVPSEDKYAAVATESTRQISEALGRVNFGACKSVLVESATLTIYLLVREDEHFAFFAEETVNTNRLRAVLNRAWKANEAFLAHKGAS
ncbi:MAG: tetratricopeptide repeat protein [Candidatus Zixiibacteriota bacterium]